MKPQNHVIPANHLKGDAERESIARFSSMTRAHGFPLGVTLEVIRGNDSGFLKLSSLDRDIISLQ